ncbi:spinster family MFS transporter [Pseudomonas sp. NFX15]|uniref:spinster family MFS transporter n=1 Tax=Pseudomonas sp. NFX15 TaxID=2816958 RepID=UPI003B8BA230
MSEKSSAASGGLAAASLDTGRGFESRRAVITLILLTLAYTCVALDRAIISVVLQPIKLEFALSDSQLGMLPLAFSLFFVAAGIPLGILADRINRRSIIAGSLLAFSLATALCGAAQSFVHLLLARIGVGAGEAGSGPAGMSMISDLFPDRQRARALSCYYLATPVGIILTFVVGGYLVGHFGWRMTFLAAGLPGVVLAIAVLILMREPVREREEDSTVITRNAPAVHLWAVVVRMSRAPALRNLTLGITLNAMVSAAILIWCAPFLLRSHGMPVAHAGLVVGLFYGAVSVLGVLGGGFIADRLSRLGQVWRTRLLSLAALFSIPTLLGTLLFRDTFLMLASFAAWAILSSLWYGPAYALTQSLVGVRQRATVASVLYLLTNLIGAGLGPQVVGLLSDVLAPQFGSQSLAYGMSIMAIGHLWAMFHFYRAGRTVERELGEQQQFQGAH